MHKLVLFLAVFCTLGYGVWSAIDFAVMRIVGNPLPQVEEAVSAEASLPQVERSAGAEVFSVEAPLFGGPPREPRKAPPLPERAPRGTSVDAS